jgi:hypothetical protein
VRPKKIDREIYYAKWNNNTGWSQAKNITDPFDAHESFSPSVAYDIWGNAIIVWTEFNMSGYRIYHYINSSAPWVPPFGPPKPLPSLDSLWSLDPEVETTPNGLALVTWRANRADWGDLYLFILNSTRYVMVDEYRQLIYVINRITKDQVTDWKHSVSIDSNLNINIVWLKHQSANVGNYTHPQMSFDDDDIYYKVIPILPDLQVEASDVSFMVTTPLPRVGDTITIKLQSTTLACST